MWILGYERYSLDEGVWVLGHSWKELECCVFFFVFLMRRRQPRSTQSRSSAASDVYKRQGLDGGAEQGVRGQHAYARGLLSSMEMK